MHRRAFTMLELIVVVIVIAVIVVIAAPRMGRATQTSRFANTLATFNAIARAAEYYRVEKGRYPPDYWNSNPHAGFQPYIDTSIFLKPTPLGGQWDWNNRVSTSGGTVSDWVVIGPNVSIVLNPPPLALWTEFDRYADDGRLTAGEFRRERTRFLLLKVPDLD